MNQQEKLLKKLQKIQKKLNEKIQLLNERQFVREALQSPCKMAQLIGYPDVDKIHFKIEEFLKNSKKKHKLILVPRNHLKTTIFNYSENVRIALTEPEKTNLIVSSTTDIASDMLDAIRNIFENNFNIRKYFGDVRGDIWQREKLRVREAITRLPDNTFTFEVMGVDKPKTSKHFDRIIVDDIVDRNNVDSPKDRDKVLRVFKDLFSLLKRPDGYMIVIGTRWHPDDLYSHIIKNMQESFDMLILPCYEIVDGRKIPLFPKKFTIEDLERIRKEELGDYAFSCQMMNNPDLTVDKILDFSKIKIIPDDEYKKIISDMQNNKIDKEHYALVIDPASEVERQTNHSGIILVYRNETKNTIDIVDMYKVKYQIHDTIDLIIELIVRYGIKYIYVEKAGLEGTLKYYLEEKLKEYNLFDFVLIEPLSHKGISKNSRIMAIHPFIERGMFRRLKSKMIVPEKNILDKKDVCEMLKYEMDTFPNSGQDDLLDALAYSVREEVFNILPDNAVPLPIDYLPNSKKTFNSINEVKNNLIDIDMRVKNDNSLIDDMDGVIYL